MLFRVKYENFTELIAKLIPLNTKEIISNWECKKCDVTESQPSKEHNTMV